MTRTALTPSQHRTIRLHLTLIPLYVWLLSAWGLFFAQLPGSGGSDAHLVRDFLHFYTQGVIAREHDVHALYDIQAMAAVADRVVPGVPKHVFPPVYGPQVALAFLPITALPYKAALGVWLLVTIGGTAWCASALWRRLDDRPEGGSWLLAVLTLAVPGLHFALSFGQASVIGLAAFTAMWVALRADRRFVAGLAVGVLAYKPQLGIVAASVFLYRREWRIVCGALAAVAGQALASALFWGPGVFVDYLHALLRLPSVLGAMEPDRQLAYSLRAILQGFELSPLLALTLSLALTLAVIATVVATWRPGVPLALRFSGLVLATLLVDPHLYGYDLLLVLPTIVVGGAWAWVRGDRALCAVLALVYTVPLMAVFWSGPPVIVPTVLAVATGLLGWRGHSAPAQT